MRFIEFVTQAGHPTPGDQSGMTLHTPCATLGGLHLFRDFVDMGVQRLQQLPCLRGIGIIGHVGIIAPSGVKRAPCEIEQTAVCFR